MRILCVCGGWRVFGAETITLKMLEGLKQNGHPVHAVTSTWSDGEFSRRLASLGVAETKVPLGTFSKKLALRPMLWTADALIRLPVLWLNFARACRKFRPSLVILTSSKQGVFLRPWLGGRPSFLVEHTNVEPSGSNRWLYKTLANRLSSFVAVSGFMREHLQCIGAPTEKIRVIRNGVVSEAERQKTENDAVRLAPAAGQPARIGIVGQVAPNKGHDCLVEAGRLLKNRGASFVVRVFGSGNPEYENRLKGKISEAGLSDVWNWMGYERDKAKIFNSLDICVVPSCFGDPFPTVAMEAGVYGLPVVASRVGGLPEIVEDGVTGWLVDSNDPAQLAEKIEWLIRNPQQARAMGAAGRERVFKHFTVERMVAEFEALFREHLAPKPPI